jgi:hypothetical protein
MQSRKNDSANVFDSLFMRLSAQGLTPSEIVMLIKDAYRIIGDGGWITRHSVNQRLKQLGWSEQIMDAISLELIVSLLENDYNYQVERHGLGKVHHFVGCSYN